MSRVKMTIRTIVVSVLGLAFACAGCGDSEEPARSQPQTNGAGRTTPPPASTVTPGQSPATKPGFPVPADGQDVKACRDGKCEILVTERTTIPLDRRFGFKKFSFDPADSTWRYSYPEGGGGELRFLEPPYSGSWAAPHGEQSLNLRVVATQGSKAVISLSPGG